MKILVYILLLVFMAGFVGCSDKGQLDETERRGNLIIQALKSFHSKHGTYPASLKALVPDYLPEIPKPTWGLQVWKYSGNHTDFSLGVDESRKTGDGNAHWYRYSGEAHGWQLGD